MIYIIIILVTIVILKKVNVSELQHAIDLLLFQYCNSIVVMIIILYNNNHPLHSASNCKVLIIFVASVGLFTS